MCTDAYRAALTRDISSPASPAPRLSPSSAPVTSQRQAAEAGREGVLERPLRRRTKPGPDELEGRGVAAGRVADMSPAMALAKDATVVNGKVIDQR
jgi:hypothetical protein